MLGLLPRALRNHQQPSLLQPWHSGQYMGVLLGLAGTVRMMIPAGECAPPVSSPRSNTVAVLATGALAGAEEHLPQHPGKVAAVL